MNLNYYNIRKCLPEFLETYYKKPLEGNNHGGMQLPHLFATWYMLRELNPTYIIESGTFKGLGTWVMEQACPKANITSIDVRDQREYISPNVYYEEEDITSYDWDLMLMNKGKKVIHFDDHQNAIERVKWAKRVGFKHLIFEDNYPKGVGNCVSLKQHPEFRDFEYVEFPPIYKTELTRWGTPWTIVTPAPVLTDPADFPEFYEEAQSYTWICYVCLNK